MVAGDWIKWRSELTTHPRFMALCSSLIYDDSRHGMLIYACGDALGIGVMPPSNESVTARALLCVTEGALRDVCMCALLRVWAAVNAHCKVEDIDAVMAPLCLVDIDAIAGFADFGEAMRDAGWVVERDETTLVFPNFREFNEPACLRRAPKTNKVRQQELRDRRAAEKSAVETVTKVTKRNGREEKSREEKKETEGAPDFDRDFWPVYPNRDGKRDARRAWDKIKPDAALWAVMLTAIERQVASPKWTKNSGEFIPLPATWLNGRRWEDESVAAPKRADPNPHAGMKYDYACGECGERHLGVYGGDLACPKRGAA